MTDSPRSPQPHRPRLEQPAAPPQPTTVEEGKTTSTKHFSLRTWIRQAPWSQYFKDACRWTIKSPLNFFIFFCCLSVVVWGAFLVLLMGNMVKLADNATQKLWIEIASQVLNGFFTLANVPVHPKRFLGLVRGLLIWKEDRSIQMEFTAKFITSHKGKPSATEQGRKEELLDMLRFFQCFPDYGRGRVIEQELCQGLASQRRSRSRSDTRVVPADVIVARSSSRSRSRSRRRSRSGSRSVDPSLSEHGKALREKSLIPDTSPIPSGRWAEEGSRTPNSPLASTPRTESRIRVDISEDDLNELLTEENHRVVQAVVMPFLPFPLDMPTFSSDAGNVADMDAARDQSLPLGAMEQGFSTSRPPYRDTLPRGSSFSTLSRMASSKRISPRTRARTLTMSMETDPSETRQELSKSTFVVHESHSGQDTMGSADGTTTIKDSSLQEPDPVTLIPMPMALSKEQMEWLDIRQESLVRKQACLQRAWPWYSYTIPSGIEPVDFFARPDTTLPAAVTGSDLDLVASPTPMLTSSPMALVMKPSRFCWIVGSFNLNSMIQEVLCGFMWGVHYLVRPGWVVGTGMALGCLAAIVPSVMIALHENAVSRLRVIATAEEAIQEALDVKKS